MANITALLEPIPPYTFPLSNPARMMANDPSVRIIPPPNMSPISDCGNGRSVNTGIKMGTIIIAVKATMGAVR